jgi:hypothetical protein
VIVRSRRYGELPPDLFSSLGIASDDTVFDELGMDDAFANAQKAEAAAADVFPRISALPPIVRVTATAVDAAAALRKAMLGGGQRLSAAGAAVGMALAMKYGVSEAFAKQTAAQTDVRNALTSAGQTFVSALNAYSTAVAAEAAAQRKREKDAADRKLLAEQNAQNEIDLSNAERTTTLKIDKAIATKIVAESTLAAKKADVLRIAGLPAAIVVPAGLTALVALYFIAKPRTTYVRAAPVVVPQKAVAGYRPGRKLLRRKRR